MSEYIDWNKITPRMKVKLVRTGSNSHYEAGGKTVLMDGRNQREIQRILDARVKADAKRFNK
jgi:hypothetical protein